MDNELRIRELEARLAELSTEVRHLRAVSAPADNTELRTSAASTSSRRGALKLAGAAAAGGAALLLTRPESAAAADGAFVTVSATVSSTPVTITPTVLEYTNTIAPSVTYNGAPVGASIFLARDIPTAPVDFNPDGSTTFPAAVGGYAFRTVPNGVYGYTRRPGYGVVGVGGVSGATGVYAQGAKANLELKPGGTSPLARTDAHNTGEIIVDVDGNVWVSVTAGTPGIWRKLAGSASAGSFHALAPARVYDSRAAAPAPGALAFQTSRLISVSAKRDTSTGNVTTADIVPAGATAIAVNVTVVNTVAGGFVTLNPGGITTTDGATVNWSATGQILNNGVIVKLNDTRGVTAVVGGSAPTRTDLVLDVTGYFL